MAARVNGLTGLAVTRLDILDSVEKLRVCTSYRRGSEMVEEFPGDPHVLAECEPIYEDIDGWCQPTTEARTYDELPAGAQRYVERLAELSRTPVELVSVGAERDATIAV